VRSGSASPGSWSLTNSPGEPGDWTGRAVHRNAHQGAGRQDQVPPTPSRDAGRLR
jgi:hypothetical protein